MSDPPDAIRVLLLDPNVLFRCGIARLLESQPDFMVVGETGSSLHAVQIVSSCKPTLILLETSLEDCDGPSFAALIHKQFPSLYLVFLTSDTNAQCMLDCVLAGAVGYLQKNITPNELFLRLRGVIKREAAISSTSVWGLLNCLSSSNHIRHLQSCADHDLTPRETQVLAGIARGFTNREIGRTLQISEHTVRNHLCNIYQKLDLQNRLQVALYCVTHGLVDLDSVR